MARAKAIALAPEANDVNYISTTESITSPWTLQLDGVTTLSTPQHVTVTTTSNETGETFTIVGTDRYGNSMTEALAGPNATVVAGTKNFATITSITGTADATGVTAGVNGLCESQWYVLNYRGSQFNVGFGVDISSSANLTYAAQATYEDMHSTGSGESDVTAYTHPTVTGETTAVSGVYTSPPWAMRVAITAHTAGSVTLRVLQSGGA